MKKSELQQIIREEIYKFKNTYTFESFLNEGKSPEGYIENNKKRPDTKGFYDVIYSDGSEGNEEWDGHSWKVYPHPVAYWKPIKESINEGSDISPERMLRSVYDNLKDNASSVKVGPFNAQRGYFDFVMDDSISGSIEARKGKILVSFGEIKINPKQYDLVYDGEVVLTKDFIRQQVSKILRDYSQKMRK